MDATRVAMLSFRAGNASFRTLGIVYVDISKLKLKVQTPEKKF